MTYSQVLERFKTQVRIAAFCDMTQGAVSVWHLKGKIPDNRQVQIHLLTNGELQCDPAVLKRKPWLKRLLIPPRAA